MDYRSTRCGASCIINYSVFCFFSLQLSKELESGGVFEGWKEGVIDFPPTYKYELNSDRHFGENFKEGEKRRTPAW